MPGPEPTMDELVELGRNACTGYIRPEAVRAILNAVLPRVLEGAKIALEVVDNDVNEDADCDCRMCRAVRRARSVLSHIDTLMKGE